MLSGIRALLRGNQFLSQTGQCDTDQDLRNAVALLLLEVARADTQVTSDECRVARQLLERFFPLSTDQAEALVATAQHRAEHETSLFPFTSLIKRECDLEERSRIVEMLWEVSCADGSVDSHEEHLVRKVAELLYVPHSRYIRAKLRHVR